MISKIIVEFDDMDGFCAKVEKKCKFKWFFDVLIFQKQNKAITQMLIPPQRKCSIKTLANSNSKSLCLDSDLPWK